jgi:8-oxo-dGTP pyrophosphatase MutT (NUDIX family)
LHRKPLLDVLERYLARHPDERVAVDHVRQFVRAHPDCFERACVDGHLTASAWIVSHDHTSFLLTHHAKLGRWLQLGGHLDGDGNLARSALREALEESGIEDLAIDPTPLDLDAHRIPARPGEPEHWHLDVRFVAHAPEGAVAQATAESHELRWVTGAELAELATDDSVRRLFLLAGLA